MAAGGLASCRLPAGVAAVREQDGRGDDRGLGRALQRHLDDGDQVVRRLAVRERRRRGVRRDVDVDRCGSLPGTSVWVCEPQSVSTDLTYRGLRLSLMSKILMPSHDALSVAGWRRAGARVVAARRVGGQEEQVAVDRDVVLRAGAEHLATIFGRARVADVVDDEAVVVAGEGVLALEREVGVDRACVSNGACLGRFATCRMFGLLAISSTPGMVSAAARSPGHARPLSATALGAAAPGAAASEPARASAVAASATDLEPPQPSWGSCDHAWPLLEVSTGVQHLPDAPSKRALRRSIR